MANTQHVIAAKGGATALATFRKENPSEGLDLSGADLQNVDLSGADLSQANLSYAVLSNANLKGTRLVSAKLDGGNCQGAQFDRADLTDASFVGADVTGASFVDAKVESARGLPSSIHEVAKRAGTSVAIRRVNSFFTFAIAVLALVGFSVIFYQLRTTQISNVEYARGLITVVFAIGTMSIAFMLVAARWSTDSTDASNRFAQSKEIFTLLVGILGTVVGWYFGQQSSQGVVSAPAIAEVQFAPREVKVNGKVTITGRIVGGTPPYQIEIEPIGQAAFDPLKETSPTPVLKQDFTIKTDAAATKDLAIRVLARDANQFQAKEYTTPRDGGIVITK